MKFDFAVVAASLITAALAIGLIFWLRSRRIQPELGPIIELERLVNCISCGSLIPEGVRKCAFCGASQTQNRANSEAGWLG